MNDGVLGILENFWSVKAYGCSLLIILYLNQTHCYGKNIKILTINFHPSSQRGDCRFS
jgi:hypothetical protein